MLSRIGLVGSAVAGLLAISGGAPANAQSTNAPPVITVTQTPIDISKLPVGDDAKQSLTQYSQSFKSGDVLAYTFAASSSGKYWSIGVVLKNTPIYNVADQVRIALERCQYWNSAPCYVLDINDHDTRLPDGGWAAQPNMLFKQPTEFDAWTIPFVTTDDRAAAVGYRTASGNRAFIITDSGGWLYRGGDTIQKAIDTAVNDCASVFKGQTCILYAINNRVVFEPY